MSATYWASWWSGNYADEGCTAPPFKFWVSGEKERLDSDRNDLSICAVVVAADETGVNALARKHFPDASMRFCDARPDGWRPPKDRFPD